jgi:hypothetical protein
MSITTLTGTRSTSCSRPPSRSPHPATSPPTRSPMAPSSAPPRATTAGKRRSLKFPPCAGPIFRRRAARPEHHQQTSTATTQPATCCASPAALAQVARPRRRHGPSPLPLRALSARRHVEGSADRPPWLGVQLPAAGRGDHFASGSLPPSTPSPRSRRRTSYSPL